MPVEKHQFWTVEWETFRLINQLHRTRENCKFPILIRKKTAFYVPFEYVAEGNEFEFIVTYHMAESEAMHRYNLTIEQLCKSLANDPRWLLSECELRDVKDVYATVAVTIQSRGASIWELQIHLMFISNAQNRERCDFNVAVKSIAKGY
ncbi:unnamed protein product [Dicrocoelium dendriticum]|nr:unnamed protein product [Dicrocoelium dendriticum]